MAPPKQDASRYERLRFVRDLSVRSLVVTVVLCAVTLTTAPPTWLAIVLGAVLAFGLLNIAALEIRLRREPAIDLEDSPRRPSSR